jgi:hypothetical protein
VHCIWGIQDQSQGDVPAGGVGHDVLPLDPQVTHQLPTVDGLLGKAGWACYMAAARAADAMVAHHPVTISEGWLIQ